MALISCFECNKQISNKAATCPNCGAPVSTNQPISNQPISNQPTADKRAGAWEGIGFLLIVVGIIIGIATESGGSGGAMAAAGFVVFLIGRFQ